MKLVERPLAKKQNRLAGGNLARTFPEVVIHQPAPSRHEPLIKAPECHEHFTRHGHAVALGKRKKPPVTGRSCEARDTKETVSIALLTGAPTSSAFGGPHPCCLAGGCCLVWHDCSTSFSTNQTTATWEHWYGLREHYAEERGHARVPASYVTDEGYRLGMWVNNQRVGYKKGKLSPERVERIESLKGWTLDPFESAWEEGFEQLERYAEKHGHPASR